MLGGLQARLFQFTPLREGRRNQRQDGGALEYFNSRPSARGDTPEQLKVYTTNGFQFTPLREGRRGVSNSAFSAAMYFNSRPSARGDLMRAYII